MPKRELLKNYFTFKCNFFFHFQTPESSVIEFRDGSRKIGFQISPTNFLTLLDINEDGTVTHKIPYFEKSQGQIQRNFIGGLDEFYEGKSVLDQMTPLLGAQNANKYFLGGSTIDKGHLAAMADYPYVAQRKATNYYINVQPQFSKFNRQNWRFLEDSIRDIPYEKKIQTGVAGLQTLPNQNSQMRAIFLDKDRKLPVPELFFKIVQFVNQNGITEEFYFIGANFPTINSKEFEPRVRELTNKCPNDGNRAICDEIDWLRPSLGSQERKDPQRGYIFCCTKQNFYSIILSP